MTRAARPEPDPTVGLCSACRHGTPQRNANGSCFWRCGLAAENPDFLRYPPLPVERCEGFEEPGAAD